VAISGLHDPYALDPQDHVSFSKRLASACSQLLNLKFPRKLRRFNAELHPSNVTAGHHFHNQ